MIDKCKKNPQKIAAVLASLQAMKTKYEAEAKHYKNKYDVEGTPKHRKLADQAKLSHYFKGEDWEKWGTVIESDTAIDSQNNMLNFGADTSVAKATVSVLETATPWEEEIAIYFTGGQKHQDMSLANLEAFRKAIDPAPKRRCRPPAQEALHFPPLRHARSLEPQPE